MFTRHLYRYDEVRAALLWCIFQKRMTEGLFWTQELLDSGCHTELFQIMFEGWIWSVGVARLEWFRQFWLLYEKPDVVEDDVLALVYSLFRLPMRDSSTLFLLLSAPVRELERLPPTPKADALLPTLSKCINTDEKKAFFRYVRLGKASSAWRLAYHLIQEEGEESMWALLTQIEFSTQGCPSARQCFEGFQGVCSSLFPDDSSMRLACQATAVGFLCLSSKLQTKSCYVLPEVSIDPHTQKQFQEWKALEGKRKRRIYAPPSDCLSWMTSRGCNPYTKTTLKEVRSLSIDILREKGCPFWQEVLETHNPWSNDDAFEEFWDTYFPDDIPDEWSLEDQKKSHGNGVLRPQETPLFWKQVHKWFFRMSSLLIWNPHAQISPLCNHDLWKEFRTWTSGFESVYESLQKPELQTPAKVRRFTVIS